MQLEAVGRVSVRDLSFQIRRQVYDMNGSKWTFLWEDATADAKEFGNVGDLGLGGNFDAELSSTHDRAASLTFLPALLGFALVAVDDSNPSEFVRHFARKDRDQYLREEQSATLYGAKRSHGFVYQQARCLPKCKT